MHLLLLGLLQAKLLALQRDIDEQSQPTQPTKPLTSQRICVKRPAETKMEEETSEESIMKRVKKLKKGKMFSPEIQTCDAENGSQGQTKKEKKWKKVGKEEEDETGQTEDKKKTNKKKRDSIAITDVIIVEDDNKKKKKKLLEDYVNQVKTDTKRKEKLEKMKRKEKKLKDKSVQVKPENMKKEEGEEIQIRNDDSPKKPKKEKGKMLVSRTAETEEVVGEKKRKKKKTLVINDGVGETKAKTKAKVQENGMNVEKAETEVQEVKLKRKKEKESKTEGFGNELEHTEIHRKNRRSMEDEKILKKKKDKLINEETVTEEEKPEVKIKKKKKSKKAQEDDGKVEPEETEPKKKKVKVEEDEVVEDEWSCECNITRAPESQSKKSKKTKNSVKEDQDIKTEAKAGGRKKKKVKGEQKDPQEFPQMDVTFLSAKTGNTDEISINPERRKALQMEIDKASQPDKPTVLGQWSTAQFDSSQQQQKFLRLMGGFKKGFQPAGTKAGGANMALGKEAQQQLQQGLLGDFERAHTRRMDFNNRGAGLGFTAASNKKFTIDVNASRSVRFDD
ncbi:hypothetical protein CHARACLAT_012752 [Characodon lateralis]|uniref:Small acidic protein-like domain-containing protein n=1 Tax=Characodon lateralis TaxID=208331 RepID=A0ABU7EIS5_9TELE|nr:hypothetical protein [Characodon lateralis]